MATTIKPFGESKNSYLLGNGSDVEFCVSLNGLVKLRGQIDKILREKGLL